MLSRITSIWRNDPILRRVVKNSGHLVSGNAVAALLGYGQSLLVVRLIGVPDLGLVTAVITFASNINRLLTFRMSEIVVQRLGAALPRSSPGSGEVVPVLERGTGEGEKVEAAAAVKAAMLTEAVTSIVAFIILAVLTPWAAVSFGKDIQTAPLFLFYGLILLTNIIAESSTGALQALRRFDSIARINVAQSIVTAGLILAAFLMGRGIFEIILAYVVGKSINGLGLAVLALRELHQVLGAGWWKTPLRKVGDKRGMFTFMLNTNLNGTLNVFTRDNIPLYLAYLLGTTEAGYFKIALSLINLIIIPLDPLIGPTYSEISRTVALKQWDATRQLLRRVSLITTSVVVAIGSGLALTGWFLLPLLNGGPAAAPAYPVLLILLIGYGFASIFQWNRPLMLALGKPSYPLLVSFLVGLAELALIFGLVPLVPHFGYLVLVGIFSAYFVVSIGIIVWRGLAEITRRSAQ